MIARTIFGKIIAATPVVALTGVLSIDAAMAENPVAESRPVFPASFTDPDQGPASATPSPTTSEITSGGEKADLSEDGEVVLYGVWARSVDVETDDDDPVAPTYEPAFADGLETLTKSQKMSGFYTLRYSVQSEAPFKPYAGAGVGLVTAGTETGSAGAFAARALAGFDITVDDNSAFYAEYAFLKSGGSAFGSSDGRFSAVELPDDEHSLKVGFRRTF